VRIVGGKFRSRRLKGPLLLPVRPTSDRLREALFNILGPEIEDSLFIDAYAGTGAMGLEALSRGARDVFWIESDAKVAKLIKENIAAFGVRSGAELIQADAVEGLKKIAARHLVADFIFLDPPYAEAQECLRVLEYLDEAHLIAARGRVLVEHSVDGVLPERLERLERTRVVEQGDTAVSFYRLVAAA